MDLLRELSQHGEVHQRTSSHLALQPQDGRIPVDRNVDFFLTSRIDFLFVFGQSADNCK